MNEKIRLRIVTPGGEKLSAPVNRVRMESPLGSFGIKIGHAPMLSAVLPSEVIYYDENGKHSFPTKGGVAEIKDNCVTILE